jgi:hypothetical protein
MFDMEVLNPTRTVVVIICHGGVYHSRCSCLADAVVVPRVSDAVVVPRVSDAVVVPRVSDAVVVPRVLFRAARVGLREAEIEAI